MNSVHVPLQNLCASCNVFLIQKLVELTVQCVAVISLPGQTNLINVTAKHA